VFKSVNGGTQWTAVSEALSARILVPDPAASGILYAAGTGMGTAGVFKTLDGGGSWAFSSRGINAFALDALVTDPRTASILYAGSSQFGVFKSTDAGQTWKPANQGFPDGGALITALAIHSSDPRILYAAGFTLHEIGVFRTLDGGEHWMSTGKLIEPVGVLKIDPQDPRIVHAGTGSGIYRSTDSGATWVLTEHPDMYRSAIGDIAIDPASPAVLYAIAFWAGFPECGPCPKDGLFKSTDRGATWSLLAEGAFTKIAIDPKDPSTLYALEGIRTILKSTDGGHHWSTIARVPEPDPSITPAGLFIDPQVSTTLYLAHGNGVLRSTDGGVTWAPWNDGLQSPVTALAFDPSTPAKVLVATREAGISARLTAGVSSPCIPDSTHLCLNGGRFRVEASWKDFQGNTGVGKTLPLTNDTGAFWFFGPDNLELTVKVLDGRTFNGRFWVFYGSLTNVEFAFTVTDTVTQQQQTYRNPAGHFASAGDTSAF
jgi:photosystem II stability/assembly factor-like uncharacterized protein